MSELSKIENADFSRLDNMSSAKLWSIVDDEFYSPEGKEPNTDLMLYIMELLEKRGETAKPNKDISTIWNGSQSEAVIRPPKRTGRKVLRFAVSFAAAIALLFALAVTANATGNDVFDAIATWTDETFSFVFYGEAPQTTVQNTKVIPDVLTDFAAMLDENGFNSGSLLPGYIGGEYEVLEMHYFVDEAVQSFVCYLADNESKILLSYLNSLNAKKGSQFEKDEGVNPEKITINGTEFYILTNYGTYYAVWMHDSIECMIYGYETEDELIKVLESI